MIWLFLVMVAGSTVFNQRLHEYRKLELPKIELEKQMFTLSLNSAYDYQQLDEQENGDLDLQIPNQPLLNSLISRKIERLQTFVRQGGDKNWFNLHLRRMQRGCAFLRGQVNPDALGWGQHYRLFFWSDFIELAPLEAPNQLAVDLLLHQNAKENQNAVETPIPQANSLLLETVFMANLHLLRNHPPGQSLFNTRLRQLQSLYSIRFATMIHQFDPQGRQRFLCRAMEEEFRRKRGSITLLTSHPLIVTITPKPNAFMINRILPNGFQYLGRLYLQACDESLKHPRNLTVEVNLGAADLSRIGSVSWSFPIDRKPKGHPSVILVELLTSGLDNERVMQKWLDDQE